MDPVKNPFSPGAGTRPMTLEGREQYIHSAEIALKRIKEGRGSRGPIYLGLRGVGKTVLLNHVVGIAEKLGYETLYIEAPEDGTFVEALVTELRKTLFRLDRLELAKDAVKKAMSALSNFASTFKVTYGDIGVEYQGSRGSADSGILEEDMTDMICILGEAGRESRRPIALFIDEIQYLKEKELAALICSVHRANQLQLPVIVIGAGLPQIAGLSGNAKSYAERLFEYQMVGQLDREACSKAIREPIANEGAQILPDAIDSIIEQTACYPYFIQEWGHHTWKTAHESPIKKTDVVHATKSALSALDDGFFRVRLDRLTKAEKEYLRAMAELGKGPHRSGDIAEKLKRRVESLAPTRSSLIKKGMIYAPSHGDTAFTVPMFDAYMKRAIPTFKSRGTSA